MSFLLSTLRSTPGPSFDDGIGPLLERVARRDREALRVLYDRLGGQALAIALRVLRSRSDAEEVLQEAFVDVWQRAASFDAQRGGGRGWILSIVRNRAIDRLRRHRLASRTLEDATVEGQVGHVRLATPVEEVEQREERERVHKALSDLSEPQRLALHLAYFEGLSQSEIATRIDEPLGTVKTRMRTALEKLARLLGREGASS